MHFFIAFFVLFGNSFLYHPFVLVRVGTSSYVVCLVCAGGLLVPLIYTSFLDSLRYIFAGNKVIVCFVVLNKLKIMFFI